MPLFYLHLLLGGAFVGVWAFIVAMLFRDRLLEIRRDRPVRPESNLAPPHYLSQSAQPPATRVA
jgi:hypothetical protein